MANFLHSDSIWYFFPPSVNFIISSQKAPAFLLDAIDDRSSHHRLLALAFCAIIFVAIPAKNVMKCLIPSMFKS